MAATHADPGTMPSLDLGFLDNFPEFNEEVVPVDSFFDSYVESLELGAREGSFTQSGELCTQLCRGSMRTALRAMQVAVLDYGVRFKL